MTKTIKRTYSVDDFVSKDGFLTSVWGPMLWTYLHTMSFNYPINPTKQDKKHYRDFIINLKFVMPCKYCRINLIKNFKHHPLTQKHMKNRESFSKYVYDLHELVNKMLKKTSGLTFDDVRERYENFRSRCTIDDLKIVHLSKIVKTRKTKKENGCTEPLYGKKSRCVIKIVPQEIKQETFQIDKKCIKTKKSKYNNEPTII
jgi:hypothetical protein